jgi:uncharacterized membrane protein YqaE (UPF0057 family)
MNELNPFRICLLILGIFFSWLSVLFYQKRLTIHFVINLILWFIFIIPGIVHAYWLILFTETEYGGHDLLE